MPSPGESALVHQVQRARALHDERAAFPSLAAALDRLARWQSRRLRATYADLAQNPRYSNAIAFFGSDLYGAGDFSRRDAELAHVAPLMGRMLPEGVLLTVAAAMELSVLSQELDRAVIERLDPQTPLSVASYCEAYRGVDDRASREHQIAIIVGVGQALVRYGAEPRVRSALAAMRKPERLAVFGAFQDYQERGFCGFRSMNVADELLAIIERSENALMYVVFVVEFAPFPEPG